MSGFRNITNRAKKWRPRVWIAHRIIRLIWPVLDTRLTERQLWTTTHTGPAGRLHIADTAVLNNALLNTYSGHITIGKYASFAYGAKTLAATHDYRQFGPDRLKAIPSEGRDVVIEDGVWGGENVVIVGPCRIGRHAVLAAGAVVVENVEPFAIVGGVPARKIGDARSPVRPSSPS